MAEADWTKSSFCARNECVEVQQDSDAVRVRAAGNPAIVLAFDEDEWGAFIRGVKGGEFDRQTRQ